MKGKMKWWTFAETVSIAIFLVAFAFVPFAFPADQIKLLVNGKEIQSDVPIQVFDGRVMVPVRWVSEALGANVEWDGKSKIVKITTVSSVYQKKAGINDLEGIWQGTLAFAGNEVRLVFRISVSPDGMFSAIMDSPDQGAMGIPVDKIDFKNGNVRLEVMSGRIIFEGKIKEDGLTIEGEFKEPQEGVRLPLVLQRVEQAPELHRPQEPKKPYPYKEEEVVYENKKAGVKLAGTLTLPSSGAPFPAVLLITGSGPQDRDEKVYGHRPFLVLADYLTRCGIAVLRVDDRGVGKSTGNFLTATSEDFSTDVLAGVEYLKSRQEINPELVGLLGHSEGGLIAPMVAAQSKDIAFIVLMAGQGLRGEEILQLQAALILKALGVNDSTIDKNRALQKRQFTVLKQEKDNVVAAQKLRQVMIEEIGKMSAKEKEELGYLSDTRIDQEIQQLLSPWFRYYVTYDPTPVLMKVSCPVLALISEKDLQVPPKENLQAIEKSLQTGGNKNYTIKELPNLNHAFQTVQTGSGLDYAKIEETISPVALKIIGDWILQQAGKR